MIMAGFALTNERTSSLDCSRPKIENEGNLLAFMAPFSLLYSTDISFNRPTACGLNRRATISLNAMRRRKNTALGSVRLASSTVTYTKNVPIAGNPKQNAANSKINFHNSLGAILDVLSKTSQYKNIIVNVAHIHILFFRVTLIVIFIRYYFFGWPLVFVVKVASTALNA